MEVANRFKGLDLIECLKNYGWRFMTLYRREGSRPSPRKRNAKKAKWLPGEALQIAVKRREAKSKGEKKRYTRTGHGTTDWFQIGKGVRQGCILSPCLFNFYAEYIMRNAGLKIGRASCRERV